VHCVDAFYDEASLERARAGAPPALRFQRERPPGPFDLVLLLDVVEHLPDDRAFLREIAGDVRPGGRVIASVPAWMALYSSHDRALGHFRRYRPAELRALLEASGLVVERAGGLFHSLLLPRALVKLGERARGVRSRPAPAEVPSRADTGLRSWRGGPLLTRAVAAALVVDTWLSGACARAQLGVPGLSVWAAARRP
jgi:SAM-dependent methyltransferase